MSSDRETKRSFRLRGGIFIISRSGDSYAKDIAGGNSLAISILKICKKNWYEKEIAKFL